MLNLKNTLLVIIVAMGLLACTWAQQEEQPVPEAEKIPAVTEQEAAYQACLERSQAMAIAWEMIEQMCREEVGLEEGDLPKLPE